MKFKIDENLPGELCHDLAQLGHEAQTVFDEGLTGAADRVIVASANRERRILLITGRLAVVGPLRIRIR